MKHHRSTLSKQIKQSTLCLCALLSLSIYAEQIGSEYGCNNLHKVQNIDNLLAQFYANIDSHCLFEIPIETLENIWGIRIFSRKQISKINKYYEEGEGIFLISTSDRYGDYFEVHLTKKFLQANHNTWGDADLSERKISISPPYHQKISNAPDYPHDDFHLAAYACSLKEEKSKEQLICFHEYIWKNSKNSPDLPHLVIFTFAHSPPYETIMFYKTYKTINTNTNNRIKK